MYHSYRGKRANRMRLLKRIFIVALCLFIIACIALLLFFPRNATATTQSTFRWPWSSTDTTQGDLNFEIVANEQGDPLPESSSDDTTTTPPTTVVAPKVVEIPADKATNATYIAQVAALSGTGVNTVAFTVKAANGTLLDATTLQPSIATLQQAGMKTIAVFYAYQDNAYAKQTPAAALQNIANQSWRNPDGERWLNPASEEANAYLRSSILSYTAIGFDEILLRAFSWPTIGRLDRIVYGDSNDTGAKRADTLSATLKDLVSQAAPTSISVALENATAENGLYDTAGQDVAKLYPLAAYVYAPLSVQTATSGDSIRTIIGSSTQGDTTKIIPMYTDTALIPSLLASSNGFYFSTDAAGSLSAFHTP